MASFPTDESGHLSDAEIEDLVQGRMPSGREAAATAHVEQCELCRRSLDKRAGVDAFHDEFAVAGTRVLAAGRGEWCPGECVGGYRLQRVLAHGGMAVVYAVVHEATGRELALKVLLPSLVLSEESRQRFGREARRVEALQNPHVLPVLEAGEHAGLPYLVMPLVKGGTLQQRLEQSGGKLPLDEVRTIGAAVAHALGAAHEAGLVHRDLKPSNVLLEIDPGDRIAGVYLSDFGVARAEGEALALTQTGSFLGTPQYMSPEQASGVTALTGASDLFSMGVMLHQLATGELPFEGPTFAALSMKIIESPPELGALAGQPQWFAHLIERLLAKRPEQRPESASWVAEVLEQGRDAGTSDVTRLMGSAARWRRRQRQWRRGLAVLFLAAMGLLSWTEATGRTVWVNRLLVAKTGRVIYIRGQWGTYASGPEAIAAAVPGAVIEVCSDLMPTPGGGLRIPPEKPLTLRAAPGFTPLLPVLGSGIPPVSLIESEVTFEGFVIDHRYAGMRPGPLLMVDNGASVRFVRCRMVRQPRDPVRVANAANSLVAARDAARVIFEDCELYAPGSPIVGLGGGTRPFELVMKNCVVLGKVLWSTGVPPPEVTIRLDQCEVGSVNTFGFSGPTPARSLHFAIQGSLVFSLDSFLKVTTGGDNLENTVRWGAVDNAFITEGPFMAAANRTLLGLTDWLGALGTEADASSHDQRGLGADFDPDRLKTARADGPALRLLSPESQRLPWAQGRGADARRWGHFEKSGGPE